MDLSAPQWGFKRGPGVRQRKRIVFARTSTPKKLVEKTGLLYKLNVHIVGGIFI
ncbi:hypothetical protein [Halobacillus sp. Marseille-P3879]|uniref:hypothetical protein n=1 Tax=Halobacillus sp. Marseille-P3879 TaxID=2045014 RepID=UPI001358919B|nr:hypothetical protein [Halobacillus sp. Marseille-P3879]